MAIQMEGMFKHLTFGNHNEFFLTKFTPNEFCTYDPDYFLFSDVKKLALKAGLELEYVTMDNYPYTRRVAGDCCFLVKSRNAEIVTEEIEQNKNEELFFDPKNLVC